MLLHHFSPLPPLPNGIADYADRLNAELAKRVTLRCISDKADSSVPQGVALYDFAQIDALSEPDAMPLYQIGNNKDHTQIYKRAIEHPGVTILHDLRLFYLHELMETPAPVLHHMFKQSNPQMAAIRAHEVIDRRKKISLDYVLFDMVGELLRRSRLTVVHSEYARNLLRLHHGDEVAQRIHVLPHFALLPPKLPFLSRRRSLKIGRSQILMVSSGFATRAKRFDWVAQSLSQLVEAGHDIYWVHAGSERKEEFNLTACIAQYPNLAGRTTVTGYLEEEALDAWVDAADVVLNLRFPSVGESSGTLARAMAMGKCCLVNKTAAYAELPEDCVVQTATHNGAASLTHSLGILCKRPSLRRGFGKNAKAYAAKYLGIGQFADRLVALCQKAQTLPPLQSDEIARQPNAQDRLVLGHYKAKELSTSALEAMLPAGFTLEDFLFQKEESGDIKVTAIGQLAP